MLSKVATQNYKVPSTTEHVPEPSHSYKKMYITTVAGPRAIQRFITTFNRKC